MIKDTLLQAASALALSISAVPVEDNRAALEAHGQRQDNATIYLMEGARADAASFRKVVTKTRADGTRLADGEEAGDGQVTEATEYFAEFAATWGEPCVRYDWDNDRYYIETLRIAADAVDLSRVASGVAPLLTDHWSRGIEQSQKGVLTEGEVRTDTATGLPYVWVKAKLSPTENNRNYRENLQAGIYPGCSVGIRYSPNDVTRTQRADGVWVYEINRFQIFELSSVSVPAGSLSSLRSDGTFDAGGFKTSTPDATKERSDMTTPTTGTPAPETDTARSQMTDEQLRTLRGAERLRIDNIRSLGDKLEMDAETVRAAIDGETTFEAFAATASRADTPANRQPRIEIGDDRSLLDPDAEFRLRTDALVATAQRKAPEGKAEQFRNQTLADVAKMVSRNAGLFTSGRSDEQIVATAIRGATSGHAASDFQLFLGGGLERLVIAGYEARARKTNIDQWTVPIPAKDYNQFNIIYKGMMSGIGRIPENGTFPAMSKEEYGAAVKLAKHGGTFGMSLEGRTNDRLGLLFSTASDMGLDAANNVQFLAEMALASGERRDAKTQVLKTIYNKADGTLLDPAAAFDQACLDELEDALSGQTEPLGKGDKPMNYTGGRLLYGRKLHAAARRLNMVTAATRVEDANIHAGIYEMIRLQYADPQVLYMQDADAKTIGIIRQEGNEGPKVNELPTDGLILKWSVLDPVDAAVIEDRGIAKRMVAAA